jgi:hypothetical protein
VLWYGDAGQSGESGTTGSSGSNGADGDSGESGTSGTSGSTGSAGNAGESKTSGTSGSTGSTGAAGQSEESGTSGTSGSAGSTGSAGAADTSGSSGTSGSTGTSGIGGGSGVNGTSGSTGTRGSSGGSGSSGSSGGPGTSGSSGSAGSSGNSGTSGKTGTAGTSLRASEAVDVYDNAGGQTFTTGTITLNLDTTRINTDTSVYNLSGDVLTVNSAIRGLIQFRVSTDVSSGTARSISYAWLERDTGSGYSEVDGSRVYMYNRSTASGENTGTASLILSVSAGDKFRIRVARLAGSDTIRTIADASGLMIVDLAGGNTGPAGTAGTSGGAGTPSTFEVTREMRQNTSQGAQDMKLIVGSVDASAGSSITTANISELSGKTLSTDCYVVATVLNPAGGAAQDVDVTSLSGSGAITFALDSPVDSGWIMYHVWYR